MYSKSQKSAVRRITEVKRATWDFRGPSVEAAVPAYELLDGLSITAWKEAAMITIGADVQHRRQRAIDMEEYRNLLFAADRRRLRGHQNSSIRLIADVLCQSFEDYCSRLMRHPGIRSINFGERGTLDIPLSERGLAIIVAALTKEITWSGVYQQDDGRYILHRRGVIESIITTVESMVQVLSAGRYRNDRCDHLITFYYADNVCEVLTCSPDHNDTLTRMRAETALAVWSMIVGDEQPFNVNRVSELISILTMPEDDRVMYLAREIALSKENTNGLVRMTGCGRDCYHRNGNMYVKAMLNQRKVDASKVLILGFNEDRPPNETVNALHYTLDPTTVKTNSNQEGRSHVIVTGEVTETTVRCTAPIARVWALKHATRRNGISVSNKRVTIKLRLWEQIVTTLFSAQIVAVITGILAVVASLLKSLDHSTAATFVSAYSLLAIFIGIERILIIDGTFETQTIGDMIANRYVPKWINAIPAYAKGTNLSSLKVDLIAYAAGEEVLLYGAEMCPLIRKQDGGMFAQLEFDLGDMRAGGCNIVYMTMANGLRDPKQLRAILTTTVKDWYTVNTQVDSVLIKVGGTVCHVEASTLGKRRGSLIPVNDLMETCRLTDRNLENRFQNAPKNAARYSPTRVIYYAVRTLYEVSRKRTSNDEKKDHDRWAIFAGVWNRLVMGEAHVDEELGRVDV